MNLEERIRQLRQAKTQIPGILARAGMNAALRAVEKAVEETPPTVNSLRGTNTRTGEMKQHWVTDSRPRPVRQGDSYVSEHTLDTLGADIMRLMGTSSSILTKRSWFT